MYSSYSKNLGRRRQKEPPVPVVFTRRWVCANERLRSLAKDGSMVRELTYSITAVDHSGLLKLYVFWPWHGWVLHLMKCLGLGSHQCLCHSLLLTLPIKLRWWNIGCPGKQGSNNCRFVHHSHAGWCDMKLKFWSVWLFVYKNWCQPSFSPISQKEKLIFSVFFLYGHHKLYAQVYWLLSFT